MKDILGRELQDYDLVVGMIVSRDSDGMRFGVYKGNSVFWKNGVRSKVKNVYLIESPNEKEYSIKNKICKEIEEHEKAKEVKLEYIKSRELKIGGIYETSEGLQYAYLGKGNLNTTIGREETSKEGYIYLYMPSYSSDITVLKSMSFDGNIYLKNLFSCLKSKKKFIKDTGEFIEIIDNPCIITETFESIYGDRWSTKVSITLEEV